MFKLDIGCYLILTMGSLDSRTVSLKVDCPQAQCAVSLMDLSTVSLRLLDLSTVADCAEDSVYPNLYCLI